MKRWQQYEHLPRGLRKARLDNIALVPASLLPYRARYQAIANRLPPGDVLVVLPNSSASQHITLTRTIALFEAKGYRVTAVVATEVMSSQP